MAGRVRAGLTPREGRRFGFTVGGAFFVIAAISLWRGHEIVPLVLGGLGGALVLGGLIVPGRMGPVYERWMALAVAISKVTTPIFMGIVYYLVLTPTGLVMRLLGHRPLRAEPVDEGFWVRRDADDTRSNLTRQF